MPDHAPRTRLATHAVTNQPSPPGDRDLLAADRPLREALAREAPEWVARRLAPLGREAPVNSIWEGSGNVICLDVLRLAQCLQAALLVRHGPSEVAETFCAARLGDEAGPAYGVLPSGAPLAALLARIES
ncbi:hypothetical protein [Halomonas sp. BM-2019]|uniref:hypothetical protein n=1 Tax=Halomonas sp. BM-2019 TaxID=2811227 RepID=UPI0031FD1977